MQAAIINKWGNSNVFEIRDISKPTPAPDQILIKVFASSINPVDWKHRLGNHKYILGSKFPIVLGYDVCGEIIEIGSEITKFKVGDIVFGDLDNKYGGGLAEYALGHEKCFSLKPGNISIEEGAAIALASLTALQALRDKANLKENQKVIINGASGGVGHFALQIAHIMGANVIAVANKENQSFIKSFNPYKSIDYTQHNIINLNEKVDVFFDVVGNLSFMKVKHLLNKGGIYINPHPRPIILLHKLPAFLLGKRVKSLLRKQNMDDLNLISEWIKHNKLKIELDKIFELKDISEAHSYAQHDRKKGKVVVKIV